MAKANPFQFSTKYQDDETDLLYYGYRYVNRSTGRWLSRDPVHEQGFATTAVGLYRRA
jgi:RHS repeat-associated protein